METKPVNLKPLNNTPAAVRKVDKGILLIWVCFLAGMVILFRPEVHGADPIGYYSWLRAVVIDKSLDVANAWDHYRDEPISKEVGFTMTTPTGNRWNQWSAGPALLWLPFYVVAHGLVLLINAAGGALPADGYSLPYVFAASIGSVLYALAGMILLSRLIRRYFEPAIAVGCTIVILFATPLVFYTFTSPLMSHATDAFAGILFVVAWLHAREHPTAASRLAVGMTIGLAAWVRAQNILLLLVPAVETLAVLVGTGTLRSRVIELFRRGLPLAIGLALLVIPLMVFWKLEYGSWVANTYSATRGDFIDPLHPHLFEVLFSTDRGLFIWNPILIVSVIGAIPLWRRDRRLTVLLVVNFLVNYYLTASLSFWSGGTSFGARYFINNICFFGIGLAAAVDWLRRRIQYKYLAAAGGVFVAWNLLLLLQYALGWVPHAGEFNVLDMVKNQFLVIPYNLQRMLFIFTNRARS